MHDMGTIIVAITGLLGAITGAYQVFNKHKKSTIDELKADSEMYRKRWLKAEQKCDKLEKELDKYNAEHKND